MKLNFEIVFRKLTMDFINKNSLLKYIIIKILKEVGISTPVKWLLLKIINYVTPIPLNLLNFYSQFIKKGNLCFDIGAWEGEYIKLFLKLGATIIAVEPQIDRVNKLKIYYGKNKKVKIFCNALGESIGCGKLSICEEKTKLSTMSDQWKTESRFAKNCKWKKIQPVSIITLDSLIKIFGIPSFCKIDVEGFEESVLKGLTHSIPLISFEFTKELLKNAKKCCNLLSNIGNVRFNCTISPNKTSFLLSRWISAEKLYYILDSKSNELLAGDIYAKFYNK